MILSGEKTEEYRDIKPYWVRRLIGNWQHYTPESVFYSGMYMMPYGIDKIRFKNGYAKDAPEFVIEWRGIEVGEPNPNWSPAAAHGKFVFILKLGKILESNVNRPSGQ